MKNLELLYQKAVENPEFREEFLESVGIGTLYISDISLTESRLPHIMQCIKSEQSKCGLKYGKSEILVCPVAFCSSVHENLYDFLDTLIYHEGFHAFEIFYGLNNILNCPDGTEEEFKLWETEIELRAEKNILKNLSIKNSGDYISEVEWNIRDLEEDRKYFLEQIEIQKI